MDYFKNERNTITDVANTLKAKLKGSKSIDNVLLLSSKNERLKTAQPNVIYVWRI